MTAPNIVNVTSIIGVTTFITGISTTNYNVILSNPASSNQVLKLNTLMAANTNFNSSVNVFVKIFNQAAGAGTSVSIASSISVPSGSSLAIIGKDTPIYIEENRSIGAFVSSGSTIVSATNSLDIVASYEVIS